MSNRLQIFLVTILLSSLSCTNNRQVDKQYSYFDLEGFFNKEASKLQKSNPKVSKTVRKNTEIEKRILNIADWSEELSLFTSSDINKPAWRNSYQEHEKEGEITYFSTDPKLRTEKILIQRDKNGKIKHISIVNKVSNSLYSSRETLNYFPDSLYQIFKEQKVRLLGQNNYSITGKLK